jgi:hypothetical protein
MELLEKAGTKEEYKNHRETQKRDQPVKEIPDVELRWLAHLTGHLTSNLHPLPAPH